MYHRRTLSILVFSVLIINQIVNAEQDIRGKVSDQAGKPIAGATVSLIKKGVKTHNWK